MVLTVNGKAAAVVQDAEAYQRLRDMAARADAEQGIRQGPEDAKKGRSRQARKFFAEFEAAHGLANITTRAQRDLAGLYGRIHAESSQAASERYAGLKR